MGCVDVIKNVIFLGGVNKLFLLLSCKTKEMNMRKNLFYLLLCLLISLSACEKENNTPDAPVDPDVPINPDIPANPEDNNTPLAWRELHNSIWEHEYEKDLFIGIRYANAKNFQVSNDPWIYVGGIYPEKTFLARFDREIMDSINPIDIIFNFPTNPYIEEKSKVGRISYLKILKNVLKSKEYKDFVDTRGNKAYRIRMAEMKSYEDIEKAFPDNVLFGKSIREIVFQKYGKKHKKLSIGEIISKNFTVSMDTPANGIFKNTHRKDSIDNPVYIHSITYGSVGYFVIESDYSYEDVFNAFKGIKMSFKDSYTKADGVLHNSKITLFTISDNSHDARVWTSFEDLDKYLTNPYYYYNDKYYVYGYPIYCRGCYAKDNSFFKVKNDL